jgi:hypothetical protein
MRKPQCDRAPDYRESSESRSEEWISNEVMGCKFQDVRHGKRLRRLLDQLSGNVSATTPRACQDWANTKAAYRFFSNERVTMLNRTSPDAVPEEAFTELDQYLLDELVPNRHGKRRPYLGHYIVKLAQLGGYLARAHDPPPGNIVIWRGLSRLTDIELGIMIGGQLVGN